jgi:hypothetical protein
MFKRAGIVICVLIVFLNLMLFLRPFHTAKADSCLNTPNGEGCRAGLPIVEYQELLDEILLYPEPNVHTLPPNGQELNKFIFHRLTNAAGTTIYNGPGGQPIGSIAPGFNFVSVSNTVDGWVEINPGQWVVASDTTPVRPSTFSGVYVDPNAPYPMAWIVYPTRPSPYPGGQPFEDTRQLEKYTRVNLYTFVEVDGWRWYLVGPEKWVKQIYIGKVLYIDRPEGVKGRWFAVDLYEQVLVAYEEDTPVFATLISSGLPDWETNEGTFTTWARIANAPMSGAEGQEDFYSLENVPWTLYFDDDISLHGTYWHDGFGYRHSHGCVNMTVTDAHWAFQWTLEGGYEKPMVHVWASGVYR